MAAHDSLGVLAHGEDQSVPSSDTSQTPATSLVSESGPGQTHLWSNPSHQSFHYHPGCEDLSGLATVHADFA